MKQFLLVFVAFLSLACNKSRNKVYNVPLLKKIITAYTMWADSLKEPLDLISVNLSTDGDSLRLVIVNAYPEVDKMIFNLDTTINGVRLIFTGKKIQGYSNTKSGESFPRDIILKAGNKQYLTLNRYSRPWVFEYRNERMIYYFPKKEIEEFFPPVLQVPGIRGE